MDCELENLSVQNSLKRFKRRLKSSSLTASKTGKVILLRNKMNETILFVKMLIKQGIIIRGVESDF